jgi:hypothetical protein
VGAVVMLVSCAVAPGSRADEPVALTPTPTATVSRPAVVEPTPTATQAIATPTATAATAAATVAPTPTAVAAEPMPPTPASAHPPGLVARDATPAPAAQVAQPTPSPVPPDCVFAQGGVCEITLDQCGILGSPGPDTLLGSATADLICGLGGDDTIDGGGGDDTLIGGEGDDRLDGGSGADCLLGGKGRDTVPGFNPDRDIERTRDASDKPARPFRRRSFREQPSIDRRGRCRLGARHGAGPGGGREEQVAGGGAVAAPASGGAVDAPAQTGSLIASIARLLEEERTDAFPVTIPRTARAENGVVAIVLGCPQSTRSGTLILDRRVGGQRRVVGKAAFTCEPPTQLAKVKLTRAGRDHLQRGDDLRVRVRIVVDGLSHEGLARLTIHAEDS